mgnify:CR=1 FL=1
MKKMSHLLAYMDTGVIIILSVYVILILFKGIIGSILIPMILATVYLALLISEKEDTVKNKVISFITVLPFLSLSVIATIKQ